MYTKTGDNGETGIIGGKRLPKDDVLIEAIGTVDELNAVLGIVIGHKMAEPKGQAPARSLTKIQNDLFLIGSFLAGTTNQGGSLTRESPLLSALVKRISEFEKEIDKLEKILPPLKNFILPGGIGPAAYLHLARAVSRRAERRVVSLQNRSLVDQIILKPIIQHLNRLSDYLFVLARLENFQKKIKEDIWFGS